MDSDQEMSLVEEVETPSKNLFSSILSAPKILLTQLSEEFGSSPMNAQTSIDWPWGSDERLRQRILDISLLGMSFKDIDASEFHFEMNERYTQLAMNLLEYDKPLSHLRFELVPKKMKENDFWKTYFYLMNQLLDHPDYVLPLPPTYDTVLTMESMDTSVGMTKNDIPLKEIKASSEEPLNDDSKLDDWNFEGDWQKALEEELKDV